MAVTLEKLTATSVKHLKKPGRYNDGGGLYLLVLPTGNASWVFRWRDRLTGKHRDKGLGPTWRVTLQQARAKAKDCRDKIDSGLDPIGEVRARRAAKRRELAEVISFKLAAERYIEAHAPGWKNPKHSDQWTNTLTAYAFPKIGALPVSEIETPHVMDVLSAIWKTKTETASRLRGRIERVLGWATTSGYRTGDNPARWRGHLDNLLPKPTAVAKVKHHAALPYQDAAAFLVDLRKEPGEAARALEFAILTAARSGEVRGATWAEIDLGAKLWIVPADRMKASKEHRVPLTDAALALFKNRKRTNGPIFPGAKGKPLSDMAFSALLRRMKREVTAHGFRSTFRDWAGELSQFPREVIEHALAHQLKDKAEAAYARGDLLAKRRLLMEAWAEHCNRKQAHNVTPIATRKSSRATLER